MLGYGRNSNQRCWLAQETDCISSGRASELGCNRTWVRKRYPQVPDTPKTAEAIVEVAVVVAIAITEVIIEV